jgi:hypothetical protein
VPDYLPSKLWTSTKYAKEPWWNWYLLERNDGEPAGNI